MSAQTATLEAAEPTVPGAALAGYRATARKLAKLSVLPEAERERFTYRGTWLELRQLELELLAELSQSSDEPRGWRLQVLDTLALTLMWAELSAQPPEENDAHRKALAEIAERVRVLRQALGNDVEGASPTTFDLLEHCEQRLAGLADQIIGAKLARASTPGVCSGPLDSHAAPEREAALPPPPRLQRPLPPTPCSGETRKLETKKATATAIKKTRRPLISRTARNRVIAAVVVYGAAAAWVGQIIYELRLNDVTIVREISEQTFDSALPSARVIETDEEHAMARIDVGAEWLDWNDEMRLERALLAVQAVSARGYRQVDLVESGALVARWSGGVVDLL